MINPKITKKAQSIAAISLKNIQQQDKAIRRAELNNFLRNRCKKLKNYSKKLLITKM